MADAKRMSWLDRGIAWIDPVRASKRLRARAAIAAYTGASKSRRSLESWLTTGNDADSEMRHDLDTLRDRSRDLAQNNPLARGALETKNLNVIGTGLRLRPQIDHEKLGLTNDQANAWERNTRREFALWADSTDCAIDREATFCDSQQLAYYTTCLNGDALLSMPSRVRPGDPYRLRLQVIEADRLSNPDFIADTDTLRMGVEKDADGATLAYHVSNRHPGDRIGLQATKWTRLPAFGFMGLRQVILLRRQERPMQTRGLPDLTPVIEPFKQLGRYTDAELMAAVISGMFTVFVHDETGGDPTLDIFQGNPNSTDTTARTDGAVELGNGAIVGLGPGKNVSFANPGRPNTAFDPFVTAILRQIGVGLGLPYELLVKQFTTSYTAARAALLQAWSLFRVERYWFATHFCQPIYVRWLHEAVILGRINAPGLLDGDPAVRAAWCHAEWIGAAPPILDEAKAVKAATERINAHLSTRDAETLALTGADYESDHRQRVLEAEREGELASATAAASPAPAIAPTDTDMEDDSDA